MRKIAIDARFLLRKQRGMPLYVYMLCKHLPRIMRDCHFYLLINKGFEHNDFPVNYATILQALETYDNISIINKNADDEISWEQQILPKLIKSLKIDLLHMPGNRVCFFTKTPQIVTFHDVMEWSQLKQYQIWSSKKGMQANLYSIKINLYKWLTYYAGMRKAGQILTISNYAKTSIINAFPSVRNKISFVYHGIPESFDIGTELVPGNERKGVFMLGGDSQQKNPRNAIYAWTKLPDKMKTMHPLTIAGFTGDKHSEILKTIKELEIQDKVNLKGWISSEELTQLFRTSSLFLFVSREEGFGFPLLQAMASGTPTITSTADVLLEIGKDAILSAHAESAEEIAKQMSLALTNKELWLQLQQKSMARAKEFSWQNTTAFIAQLYRKQLAE